MAKEGKEAYWILYSYWEKVQGENHCRERWKKVLTEEAMWKFVARFSRKTAMVEHVIKGKRIKVN